MSDDTICFLALMALMAVYAICEAWRGRDE